MAYDTAGPPSAAVDHHDLAAKIDPIVSQIGRLHLDPAVLGLLPSAATFASALDHARLDCATTIAREVDDRARQGQKTTAAAALADQLATTTNQIASRPATGPPSCCAAAADHDFVADSAWFSNEPTLMNGVTSLSTAATGGAADAYLTGGTTAQYNFANVTAGAPPDKLVVGDDRGLMEYLNAPFVSHREN